MKYKIGGDPYETKDVQEKVLLDAFIRGDDDAAEGLISQHRRSMEKTNWI